MPLRAMLDELDDRNRDNVSRTESYLELYTWTLAYPPDLPWLLMAHLVSRNAGYLMTDLARQIEAADEVLASPLTRLFVMMERANFLIFHDAWHHVSTHLLGETARLAPPRTPRFMCEAWARYEATDPSDPGRERALVMDLVHNEQHLIERRAVHHPDLAPGLRLLRLIEASGKERPLVFPPVAIRGTVWEAPAIAVGDFGDVTQRIATGARIFDAALADRDRRAAMYEWATQHPHTGSRAVYGGKTGPSLREVWPIDRVRALWSEVHAPPEHDPQYP